MKIAVIFHRLGPYHIARLNALARRCDVTALELTDMDSVYAWDKVSEGCAFKRRTLFSNLDGDHRLQRSIPKVLAAALDEERPDAVAAPGWGFAGALAALQWCLGRRVPAIMMSESTVSDHPRGAAREFIKGRVVRGFSSALVGGKTSAEYARSLGMDPGRIAVGYDVVDNRHFEEGADRARADAAALRARLSLPANYWLASCRFIPPKNLPALLRAYARFLADAGREAPHLVILGDGPLKESLASQAGALGLGSKVRFPGFAQYPELPAYYGLASAFVHASLTEPWGLVVNEAMAAGLPLLVSETCGCAPDLLQRGVNGLSFDPRSEDSMVQGMRDLFALGPEKSDSMGRASRAIIAQWSPDRFATGMLEAAEAGRSPAERGGRPFLALLLRGLAAFLQR